MCHIGTAVNRNGTVDENVIENPAIPWYKGVTVKEVVSPILCKPIKIFALMETHKLNTHPVLFNYRKDDLLFKV